MNRRLTLLAPTEVDDGQGGVVRSSVAQAVLWASVVPLAAREGVAADTDRAALRARITLRAGVTLSRAHRLADGDSVYRIIAWRSRGRGALLEIDAETEQT
ncbi:head-tail adaptor protein [Rhodopseudomonas sp.]|uniref:head-tail adaptor protein n=1 Tax=Rhodopseudomonas sp. TaxID=1078 RepID=UPI0039E617EA